MSLNPAHTTTVLNRLPAAPILPETGVSLEEVEKKLILQALERAKYNKTIAAKLLNISYSTLRYRLEKMGIK